MRTAVIVATVLALSACTGPVPTPADPPATDRRRHRPSRRADPGRSPEPSAPARRTAAPPTPVPTAQSPETDIAIDCGPMGPKACERRVATLLAGEDPATVASITILDERGSYTMIWTNGEGVTGIIN